MHITNLYLAASLATVGQPAAFESALYDLHAIHGGFESWDVYAKGDPTAIKGDIEVFSHDHAHFEIRLDAVGFRQSDGRIRYHLTYAAPEQANADRPDLQYVTIFTDLSGLIVEVEF